MSAAMGKCNINAFNERKQELRALLKNWKADGTYDKLFSAGRKQKNKSYPFRINIIKEF